MCRDVVISKAVDAVRPERGGIDEREHGQRDRAAAERKRVGELGPDEPDEHEDDQRDGGERRSLSENPPAVERERARAQQVEQAADTARVVPSRRRCRDPREVEADEERQRAAENHDVQEPRFHRRNLCPV